MSVKIQKSTASHWQNAEGDMVPYAFVPVIDRKKETLAGSLHKKALAIEAALKALQEAMDKAIAEVNVLIMEQYEIRYNKKRKAKGGLTWYNFDRSIKIESTLQGIVKWDQALMTEAKLQLDDYINSNMKEANEFISSLVSAAFSNTKGMIDTGKVFQILKHQDQIKAKAFQKACELMKKAQDIDRTKLYQRIWEKQDDGSYRNINLSFSSL